MYNVKWLLPLIGIIYFLGCNEVQAIVGGDEAAEHQFKYMALLLWHGDKTCSGAIISDRHIITAAHCLITKTGTFRVPLLTVAVNTNKIQASSDPNAIIVEIEKAYVMNAFRADDFPPTADIAILKLKQSLNVDANPNLSKLKLADPETDYSAREATVAGYGYDWVRVEFFRQFESYERGGSTSGKLKFAIADVISNYRCGRLGPVAITIDPHFMCAKVKQRNPMAGSKSEGTCTGDSGSPLVYNGDTLLGVLTTSPPGCTEYSIPALYTSVAYYSDFIKNVLNDQTTSDMRIYENNQKG